MQRTFIAIALALTLSCACATYINTQNYVRGPTQAIADNETNYTNATYGLQLASVNVGELDILAVNYKANSADPKNNSANTWSLVYRKLDGKTLTGTANTSLNWTQPSKVVYTNGYAVSVTIDNDTTTNNIPQVTVYQQAVTGGNPLTRITLTNNTYQLHTPQIVGNGMIGKNIYVFYLVNNTNSTPTQVNVTSFTVGSTTKGSDFNLTTGFTGVSVSVVWGEALGSNQLYANWIEGPADAKVLKYATVDVSKGTITGNTTGTWNTNYTCFAYSTDKKWYGDLCYVTNVVTNTTDVAINYYVRYNSSTLIPINPIVNTTLYANTSTVGAVYPYGPYVAVVYYDSKTTAGNTTYSYELWNLDSLSTFKNKTTFLTTDLTPQWFRVVSGGLYTLTTQHDQAVDVNGTVTNQWYYNIKVGQVLSGSYLTSVLGFIMTIVAGVLLF